MRSEKAVMRDNLFRFGEDVDDDDEGGMGGGGGGGVVCIVEGGGSSARMNSIEAVSDAGRRRRKSVRTGPGWW